MSFQPEKITKEHVLKAFEEIDSGKIGIRPSTKYDILYEGQTYPPKDVMRLAHEYATGDYLWHPGGGEPTNKYLRNLGFDVLNKDEIFDPYNWTETHRELAEYLRDKREQTPLLLNVLEKAGVNVGTDQKEQGEKSPIEKIDPFTFFCYIYKYGEKKRLEVLQNIADQLDLTHPEGERGIPSANAQKVWMFPYAYARTGNEFDILWELFDRVLNDKVDDQIFQKALAIKNVGKTKLTEVLFYVRPDRYFPINGPSKPYLKEVLGIDHQFETFEDYQKINEAINDKSKKSYPELSYEAWQFSSQMESLLGDDAEILLQTLKKYKQENVVDYFTLLDQFIDEVAIDARDNCFTFNVREGKIRLIAGQMVIWDLNHLKENKGFAIIANNEWGHVTYRYKNESFVMVTVSDVDQIDNSQLDSAVYIAKSIQSKSEKSGYRNKMNSAFAKAAFDKEYRQYIYDQLDDQPKVDYWIFKIDPDEFDIAASLSGGHFRSWGVLAHENKINVGDKAIIWKKGKDAGCYALAEIITDIENSEQKEFENYYYKTEQNAENSDRVGLKVTHYFNDNPILKDDIKNHRVFKTLNLDSEEEILKSSQVQFEFFENFKVPLSENHKMNIPLNQILYGPPGTGKTYATSRLALEIIKGKEYVKNLSRDQILREYGSLLIRDWESTTGQITFCTFHQSFSYEDFVEGIKPRVVEEKDVIYEEQDGVFKLLCERARTSSDSDSSDLQKVLNEFKKNIIENGPKTLKTDRGLKFDVDYSGHTTFGIRPHESSAENPKYPASIKNIRLLYEGAPLTSIYNPSYVKGILNHLFEEYHLIEYEKIKKEGKPHVLIIDEINRGNVSSIFGELITLIETDKREQNKEELSTILPYSKKEFKVPKNVYIIGTMNTADRSIEALDSALRRRFEFEEMMPDYELIDEVLDSNEFENFKLSEILQTINKRIAVLLDRDHQIGHSYFLKLKDSENLEEGLRTIFAKKIIPLLQEYFFNDYVKIAMVLGEGFLEKKETEKNLFAQSAESYAGDYDEVIRYEIKQPVKIDIKEAIELLMN
ncbi:hypothetical protein BST97_02440 [Nonlabens spongiae]|uniref:AAA+ ATPase domain-containing protein n=1 Tax=Nonlabens spongiae TaxID=331648 RepID=A0A1W6MH76_9FLAO|nr:AAA family ATPase [Nonlabens spongiae]ARN76948.1 hypothetical protein BST97_02440 [Nonlabens spongiae]